MLTFGSNKRSHTARADLAEGAHENANTTSQYSQIVPTRMCRPECADQNVPPGLLNNNIVSDA